MKSFMSRKELDTVHQKNFGRAVQLEDGDGLLKNVDRRFTGEPRTDVGD